VEKSGYGLILILIILAAFFKAVSDTLKDHYYISVFRLKDARFWNPNESYKYTGFLKIWFIKTQYRADAWHISNSLMIISFCLAIVLHKPVLSWYYELIIAGIAFNVSFNLFYNKVLVKK
jgi:hypothetical protein